MTDVPNSEGERMADQQPTNAEILTAVSGLRAEVNDLRAEVNDLRTAMAEAWRQTVTHVTAENERTRAELKRELRTQLADPRIEIRREMLADASSANERLADLERRMDDSERSAS
jgi:regulator of replication initiation timing